MLSILFINVETDQVVHAIAEVSVIRHITPSEIGFTYKDGCINSCSFLHNEKIEVRHLTDGR
jgi:hypothetical protein